MSMKLFLLLQITQFPSYLFSELPQTKNLCIANADKTNTIVTPCILFITKIPQKTELLIGL